MSAGGSAGGTGGGGEGSVGNKKSGGGGEGEEPAEGKDGGEANTHSGAKPQLRVYIPGQKEFVPKTVSGQN